MLAKPELILEPSYLPFENNYWEIIYFFQDMNLQLGEENAPQKALEEIIL